MRFAQLAPKLGLYYRDRMCHRLGVTRADFYVGLFIDGRMSSVSGFTTQRWCLGKAPGPFELFGFSVRVSTYPRLNKLHMMCLSSDTFRRFCEHLFPGVAWPITEFRTTCIAKGHELKENRGVLKLTGREKMKSGLFRLSYRQPYRAWDAQHAMELFLEKEHYDPQTGEKMEVTRADAQV